MKKIYLLFLLTSLPLLASADAVEIDGIYYNLFPESESAEVTENPNKYSGDVVIPEAVTYKGVNYSVSSIGDWAFENCSGLTSVTIPNSVTSIGGYVFSGCSGLTSITIPNSVTTISSFAFLGCRGLASVSIPNSVRTIGFGAFQFCGLTSITIPKSVTSIVTSFFDGDRDNPFTGCYFLTSVKVENGNPVYDSRDNCNAIIETKSNTLISGCKNTVISSNVTTIGDCAFSNLGLTDITIPNSVTSIGREAFYGCRDLTSITIPNSVTSIGNKAFEGTQWYNNQPEGVVYAGKVAYKYKGTIPDGTTISIKDGTLGIAERAFYNCRGLTSVIFPNSVTSIDDNAFNSCSGLTSITIPNNLTSVGSLAFHNTQWYNNKPNGVVYMGKVLYSYKGTMPDGTILSIKDGTLSIAGSAFKNCNGLASITIPNSVTSIGNSAFYGCYGLTSITIPNSVISIGNWAFWYCNGLSSITIPNSVTSIGNWAFGGCSSLTDFYCFADNVPETDSETFIDIYKATLHVPVGCVDAYKAVEPWIKFKNIVEMSDETISISDLGKSTYCSNNDLDFSEFGDDLKAYVATGYDPDSKTIWMTRVTDVPAGTGIFLKGKKGDYQVPVKTSTSYYKNMLVGTLSSTSIPSSTDEHTNLYLAKDGGELKFCTIAGEGRTMGANKAYLQIPKTFKSRPASATATTESIKLTEGKSTYCSSNDLDFTSMGDALKAYVATGYTNSTGTIWMTRVYEVPAGTGIFLKGENKTHSVPTKVKGGSSQYESYLVNMLVGTLTKTHISSTTNDYKNMYLTKEGGVLKFCGIAGDGRDMNANRAYLQIPLGVLSKTRSASFGEASYAPEFCDDVIGIPVEFGSTTSMMKVSTEDVEGDNVWYNLNGQRVENPGKGLYIRNGRKVVIK